MFKNFLLSIVYWTVFLIVVVTVRFVGIEFFTGVELEFPLYLVYLNSLPGGILAGLIWVLVETTYKKWLSGKKLSFGTTVMLKTIIYFLMFMVVMFLASMVGGGSFEYAVDYTFSFLAIGNIIASFFGALIFCFHPTDGQKAWPGDFISILDR